MIIGVLAFGAGITPILTAAFPPTSAWSVAIQLMYAVAVFFTIPLQLFPAQAILAQCLFPEGAAMAAAGEPLVQQSMAAVVQA